MATTSELVPTRLGRSSSFESSLASGTASTSSSQKNSPERERGGQLVNRPSDSSISSLTASQGRQFRRVFSRQSFSGPVDAISWEAIVEEARQMIERDEFLAIVVRQKVLRHASFAEALVDSLASVFHSATIPAADWAKLFASVYQDDLVYEDHDMLGAEKMGLLDLGAVRERDPASGGLVNPFLFFKGFKSIQAHRIAHILWRNGRKDAARCIQSRCSEIWAVDIHPAAKIGAGLMIDHGTGVVIGETAVIGTNCSFLHGVTLGSTGKQSGDRHPKLGNDILVGCNSTILGNICIGSNTKIGSGSIVLKSLPCCVTAVGNPARIVGRSKCSSAANNMDLALHNVQYCLDLNQMIQKDGTVAQHTHLSPEAVFLQVDRTNRGTLSREEVGTAMGLRFGLCPPPNVLQTLFSSVDPESTGRINRRGYDEISYQLVTFQAAHKDNEASIREWEAYVDSASGVCKFLLAKARLEIEIASRPLTPDLGEMAVLLGEALGDGNNVDLAAVHTHARSLFHEDSKYEEQATALTGLNS